MTTLTVSEEDLRGHFEKHPNAILTHTGKVFQPLDPDPELIDIEDIAHALSNQCRYTGHTRFFYSVAQHCVIVSEYLETLSHHNGARASKKLLLEGLLHDASEAYLSDISRPIKKHPEFGSFYRVAEERLEKAIAKKFGLAYPWHPIIKEADTLILNTEAAQLMPENFPLYAEPLDLPIEYTPPPKAEREFLARYLELT